MRDAVARAGWRSAAYQPPIFRWIFGDRPLGDGRLIFADDSAIHTTTCHRNAAQWAERYEFLALGPEGLS